MSMIDEEVYRLSAKIQEMPVKDARIYWSSLVDEAFQNPQESQRRLLLVRNALLSTELRLHKVPIWDDEEPVKKTKPKKKTTAVDVLKRYGCSNCGSKWDVWCYDDGTIINPQDAVCHDLPGCSHATVYEVKEDA
jgi:hypothetical protein